MNRVRPVILAAVLFLFSGCSGKDVIPERKMVSIIHDLYMLDAQVEAANAYANMADTSSVYGALLDEYGYSAEDFNRSLDCYLHRPVKFKDMFNAVHKRFEEEAGETDLDPAGKLMDGDDPVQKAGRLRSRRLRKAASQPSTDSESE